ncbi:hypothetical protein Droror1_Dr00015404 [Drosera rotundifolia]
MTIKHKSSDNETKSSPKSKQETPIRSIFCLKKITDIDKMDQLEDCFILDFDPTAPADVSKSKVIDGDLSLVAEKGQVACRDYAHARYLCSRYPFSTTGHERYCVLCYCYVCDKTAPCQEWKNHCNATHGCETWQSLRTQRRKTGK